MAAKTYPAYDEKCKKSLVSLYQNQNTIPALQKIRRFFFRPQQVG